MLSYQHAYHAGSFADLVKHLALSRLLDYLTRKDKPLLYLETHAGRGHYDLWDGQAQKTAEYKQGIDLIWPNRKKLPPVFQGYINTIEKANTQGALRYYPGSPMLAMDNLRQEDRLYLCELHPTEFEKLNALRRTLKKVHTTNTDGIAALPALLPPPEKRALVFLDPSFELKKEYKTLPQALYKAVARFATGVYCLWYPVVNRYLVDQLNRGMDDIKAPNKIHIEINQATALKQGMLGCGLWVINPPFTFAEEMKQILDVLRQYLNPGASSYLIK